MKKSNNTDSKNGEPYIYSSTEPYCLIHGYGHWTKEHVNYDK